MTHAAEELDLVFLYLLPPAAPVTLLPASQVAVHVPGEQPEPRRNPVNQGHLGGTV